MKKTIVQETLRCLLIRKHQGATTDNLFIFNILNSSGDSFSVFTRIGLTDKFQIRFILRIAYTCRPPYVKWSNF